MGPCSSVTALFGLFYLLLFDQIHMLDFPWYHNLALHPIVSHKQLLQVTGLHLAWSDLCLEAPPEAPAQPWANVGHVA